MKLYRIGLILFLYFGVFEKPYAHKNFNKTSSKSQEVSVFTISETSLSSPRGEIIADVRSFLKRKRREQTPLLLFGKFKKFGNFPQEIIHVVWVEAGVETNKTLKKEPLVKKIQSSFRYGSPLLPKRTKLKVKGDLAYLLAKAESLLKSEKAETPDQSIHKKRQNSRQEEERFFSLKERSKSLVLENDSSLHKDQERKKSSKKPYYGEGKRGMSFFPLSRMREGVLFKSFFPEKREERHEEKTEEKKDDKQSFPDSIEVEILTEGCEPRIDDLHDVVVIQTRANTLKNGVIIKREACSDSSERYPIKRRYDKCPDKISKEEGFAWAQYTRYWVNGRGEIHEIDRECRVDEDIFFEILEREDACALSVDFKALTALRMAELYYKDRKKQAVVLEECRPLKGIGPLKLEKVFCGYAHDFERGVSFLQTKIIALLEGREVRIAPCSEEGEGFIHQTSSIGCEAIIESESGKRFAQVRTIIETQQGPLLITGCRPSQELEETYNGCETKFDHDMEVGKSRGYTRFFYAVGDHKTYVTECLPCHLTFPHHVRITGYEHFDDLKFSKPKTEIYIDVPYAGSILVDGTRLRSDAQSLPYHPKEIRHAKDELKSRFEGCFKLTPLKRIQIYERPDQSLYEEFIGEGEAKRSENLCKTSEETQEAKSSSWVWSFHGKPFTDTWHPGGGAMGWISCVEASNRISLQRGNGWSFFLYYYSQVQKRLKTIFPSGEINYTPWQVFGTPQKIKEQTCHYG